MRRIFTWMALAMMVGGCRAKRLADDQSDMRGALLDMYADQVIDNLARIKLGMPAIQVDFKTMTGTATDLSRGVVSVTRDMTNVSPGADTAKTTPALSGQYDRTSQLTVTGDPVLDPKVYLAYEQYLGLAGSSGPTSSPAAATAAAPRSDLFPKPPAGQASTVVYVVNMTAEDLPVPEKPEPLKPGQLESGPTKPEDGTFIVCTSKRYGGNYYWVPIESKNEFWALYKKVILRGKPGNGAGTTATDSLKNSFELFRLNQQLQFQ